MSMRIGSVFTGIGGFDEGFRRAGFQVAWMCEREPFCRTVLARHFADVPCFEDVTTLVEAEPIDVLVGGFPCQDVSVAGQRKGLSGERTGLFFEFMRLVDLFRPKVVVLENVPGLLTSQRGRDFHTVLSEVAERRFRRCYRILDSRYFGVAQRRRRVFIVNGARDAGECARQVLLESEGRTGRAQAGEEAGTRVASTLRGRSARRGVNEPGRGGEDDSNLVAIGVHANQRGELRTSPVTGSLNASKSGKQLEGILSFDNRQAAAAAVPATLRSDCHSAQPMVAFALNSHAGTDGDASNRSHASGGPTALGVSEELAFSLRAGRTQSVAFASSGERERALTSSMHKRHDDDTDTLIASPVTASAGHHGHSSPRGDGRDNIVVANTLLAPNGGQRTDDLNQTFQPTLYGVRRLTPLECERVQGFPDGWTCLCGEGHRGSQFCSCPDTPRYKALGNAVTVPVAEWIARRLIAALRG